MRYWWVNQNQTYRHEMNGGYAWLGAETSRKHQSNPTAKANCAAIVAPIGGPGI
jgi:hypothetical protein